MSIHKEGRVLLTIMLIVLMVIIFAVHHYVTNELWHYFTLGASGIIFLLVLQFFRYPHRKLTKGDKLIVAPADGKVVVIEEANEPEYIKDRKKQISIFMSPLNVHVNRTPVEGEVSFFKYHPGKYLVAWHPKSSTENERTTMVVKMHSGVEILVRQIAGAVARRIKWYVKEGDTLNQCEEFGFIKFGSRVDVFIPLDAEVKVVPNQKVKGGVTVLAELK